MPMLINESKKRITIQYRNNSAPIMLSFAHLDAILVRTVPNSAVNAHAVYLIDKAHQVYFIKAGPPEAMGRAARHLETLIEGTRLPIIDVTKPAARSAA